MENNHIPKYMGNPCLKAGGSVINFTQEQFVEYYKCSQDCIYFIENYMKIISLDSGIVPFKLYDYQKDLIRGFLTNRFVIAKLSRQVGKTYCTVAYILWKILFHKQQNIAILANKAKTAMEILDKLKRSYETVPLWMQQGVLEWNKFSLELENKCRVLASSTSGDAIRGTSQNLIFLDEFAFVPNTIAESFITSVYPTISSGKTTQIIMASTPNGMNHFYKYWTDAINGKNLYVPIEAHWSQVPGRDEVWAEEQKKQLGEDKFNQEYGTDFQGSSNTLINSSKIANMPWFEPIKTFQEGLKIFEEPKEKHVYVASVDSSQGLQLDYSVINVFDITNAPYTQVAIFRKKDISPLVYPSTILNISQKYNNAFVLLENNDIGAQVGSILHKDLEYEYCLGSVTKGRNGQQLTLGIRNEGKVGFKTTEPIKIIGAQNLKTLIENDKLILKDFDTISELTTFTQKGKVFKAEEGAHDDICMTLIFFAWMTTQGIFKDLTNSDIRKQILEKEEIKASAGFFEILSSNNETPEGVFVDNEGNNWEIVEKSVGGSSWWGFGNDTDDFDY